MSRTPSHKNRESDHSVMNGVLANSVKSVLVTAGVAAIANMGRKVAAQAPTATASDWCAGLVREHAAILAGIDKLAQLSSDRPQRRAMQLAAVKQLISKHAIEEENVIYPMLRREEQSDTVDNLNSDHGEVKAMLFELTEMDKADPAFATTVERLREALEEHMREEEDNLFPALHQRLSDQENRKLARTMNLAGVAVA